jgi:chitinase
VRRAAAALLLLTAATAAPAAADFVFSPYLDVTQGLDAAALPAEVPVLTWAFATGECGHERWGEGIDTEAFARRQVAAFVAAGRGYIVSTGGEAGIFSCDSDEAFARFFARYDSPRLLGLDFDIEGRQTPAQIDALVRRLKALRRPGLRISFTLATHAADDGSGQSLNALGREVLQAVRRHGLDEAVFNLMVMNYGPPEPRHCVRRDGRCDMAASALQAAHNVHRLHGVPYRRIALTPMLGENDVAGNVFTLDDARVVARAARQLGLAGLHHWSLGRDRSCAAGSARVSPVCHGLPGLAPLDFTRAMALP